MYESLRKEIDEFLKEIGTLATSSILASAAVWGWILVNQDKIVSKFLLFVPAFLVFLAGMRAYALREGTLRANKHLARLERAFGFDERLGWHIDSEKQFTLHSGNFWSSLGSNPLGPWLYIFWFCISVLNLILAVLLYR
jgi:hypothetical protein